MLKEILKEANRYNDVMDVLTDIITSDFPVHFLSHTYYDYLIDGHINNIDGYLIRKQASKFFEMLDNEEKYTFHFNVASLEEVFSYFRIYVDDVVKTSSAVGVENFQLFKQNPDKEKVYKILNDLFCNWANYIDGVWTIRDELKKTTINTKGDKETMMTIKETLKQAGRYGDVVSVLRKIINENHFSYPLHHSISDDNGVIWSLNGEIVRKQASMFLEFIEGENKSNANNILPTRDDFYYLCSYIRDNTEVLMINLSVGLSHGKKLDEDQLDKIRVYEILKNFFDCWYADIIENWSIPIGWKRLK